MKKLIIIQAIIFLLVSQTAHSQEYKKVSFNGAARSLFYGDKLNQSGTEEDTVTTPRLNSGHVLADIGVSIRPNKNTEIYGMLRARNDYGGFWGSGVTFDLRQLYIKGVAGGVFRYQLGDLNYRMTKFTLWNYDQEGISQTAAILRQQVDVVNYDHFYANDNSWRQQGAAGEFALVFRKYLQEVGFHAVTTRVRASDFSQVSDRLFSGFNIQVLQSKYLEFGANYANLYDVTGTAKTDLAFRNPVMTFTAKARTEMRGLAMSLDSEIGNSRTHFANNPEAPDWADNFATATIKFTHQSSGISFSANALKIGAGFRSPGAQTKRIDFNGQATAFDRITNDQVLRTNGMIDYMRESDFYTLQLRPYLMTFHPGYDNITPYGDATPNRQGVVLSVGYYKDESPVSLKYTRAQLKEERGEGTLFPREFERDMVELDVDIDQFFTEWKKSLTASFDMRRDKTSREPEELVSGVNLETTVMGWGLEAELFTDFDVMLGWQTLTYEGFDFTAVRNLYSEIVNFQEYEAGNKEQFMAMGLRYRFNEKTFLSAQVSMYRQKPMLVDLLKYDIGQLMVLYSMSF